MIEFLVNDVTPEGMRRVKVVSDAPLSASTLTSPHLPSGLDMGNVNEWKDDLLGLHYLEATWVCREAVQIRCEGWVCARQMVLWKLAPGERVSEGMQAAFCVHAERFKCAPDYAFMRKLPTKIENGFEFDDVTFLEAEWVPAGCIAVSKGDSYGFETVAVQE